jgi:hypothetical protein
MDRKYKLPDRSGTSSGTPAYAIRPASDNGYYIVIDVCPSAAAAFYPETVPRDAARYMVF